jgi:ubiquinone/menaquinone biosynthesis C-methylase UbiE
VPVSLETFLPVTRTRVHEAPSTVAFRDMPIGELRYRLRCIDKLRYAFRGDETVLDAGCGDGGVAGLLWERVRKVVAVDIDRNQAWRNRPGLEFLVANAEELPFDRGSFDVVHSKDSLHHMESPERALAEYRRVVKPGGTVLIVEANRSNPLFYAHMTAALGHQHFTRSRFRKLVRAAFSQARFGAFEAHYVPRLRRFRFQDAIEEALGRIQPFRPLLSYNYAVARIPSKPRLA